VARPVAGGPNLPITWPQRLSRLRAIGWDQLHGQDASVATLADLALAAYSWHRAHPDTDDSARSWHAVHRKLRPLNTLVAPDLDARRTVHTFVPCSGIPLAGS
jgi:hypothetical protein